MYIQAFPKTPRTKAAHLAPSTGHADSPATIVIGKKKKLAKTPKVLPKKGRKSLGKVNFIFIKCLFVLSYLNSYSYMLFMIIRLLIINLHLDAKSVIINNSVAYAESPPNINIFF